ncbi:MAG: CRISPR-associated protein Cas4 [candidate division WS1 bacterium]|nr:CRISPR-associated protein Cas4 [candidate division WS1 bacterium]
MYDEDDLLPISALNQLIFCRRRCALMLVEGQWADNEHTALGLLQHGRSHRQETESRGDLRICRGLRLRSLELGITGIADVVEFHRSDANRESAVALDGIDGLWRPFPVEHKKGREKPDQADEVQLCAQALCIEEMLDVHIPAGALFYNASRDRLEVSFTEALRHTTIRTAQELHQLVERGQVPPAEPSRRCRGCSLHDACTPDLAGKDATASRYIELLLQAILDNQETPP